MKIICSQKQLSTAVNIVQKAVSTKTTLPILKGILLEAKNNKLKLVGNDLDIGIENYIETKIVQEGSIVISSKIFGDIIRKLPDADIEIEVDDQNNVFIRCENSDFKLVGQSAVEFPELPYVKEENTYIISQDLFKNMIRQTIFATSQDETRPILTGSLIEIKNRNILMVAIDGYRLALRKAYLNIDIGNKAVVPSKTLNEVNRILGNETEGNIFISFTDKHILFTIDKTRIISRLLEGEFINYNQIIPKEYKSKVKVKTKELLDSIERASLLAKEGKNNAIKFSIKDDIMNVSSNVDIGSVNEEVNIELEGEDLDIGFNSKYLLDALKVIDSEEIFLEFTTSVSPCVIKPTDNENYIYLVLPVRLSKQ
ncbi:DNA polymerase III subunit beta [Paramaledivibacter caminithermalis]|uniref:Beta sliding clamp n=1 Tax=Paramaledivibacter caminithermalis (strain DSM 15212 / CIP 107654 / DViRD3) TaxID=1121301 RepID=A0A1M6NXP7_PARC5|nr:DNA polymerase III subunit beta [Paramaledivibacter caminithermalis]SHK00507.1 DNA polymerase III, beta subunit [Paramaledivibacter caminithermalis DSM 15212]